MERELEYIYNFLLEKREAIALQKTLATPTARLIDNPLGSGPVYPKHLSIYGIAALIGILIPALVIFLRRVFFPIFKDKDDLERVTNVPILGEISIAPSGEKFALGDSVTTPIAELFRLIRNNIQFALSNKDKKVMLVTSSLSGEGKTFMATNIGLTFALSGKKTVIIGMDIRRPVIARNFEISNKQGVTTYLSGQVENVNDIIHKTDVNDNLYVIPGGPVPPNPNELLLSDRMGKMIEELRANFDYIIIDTAPIGVVSDTYLIAQHSDVQLYVTRANYSTRRCLKIMHQAIAMGRFPKCYLILNGVNISSGSYAYRRYGYYSKYGYKSSYGYGYSQTEKRTLKSKLKRIFR
jgi:capsular exopolysaccharide synthesis family protein